MDKTIILWDFVTGALQRQLNGHGALVKTLGAVGRSGRFASSSHDHTIKIWSSEENLPLQTMSHHTAEVRPLAIPKDSGLLYSAAKDGSIAVVDIEANSPEFTQVSQGFSESLESCDELGTVACGTSVGKLMLLDFRSPDKPTGLQAHSDRVKRLKWHRGSQKLFSCSNDRTIKVWDMRIGVCLDVFRAHSDQVYSLSFIEEMHVLLSGGRNRDIKVNDIDTGLLLGRFEGHNGTVIDLAPEHSIKKLASAGLDSIVKIWTW
jgi:WD40 repeat protein